MTTTYTVTLPNGAIATRKSDRIYTHAVAYRTTQDTPRKSLQYWLDQAIRNARKSRQPLHVSAYWRKQIATYEAALAAHVDVPAEPGEWGIAGFCGRPDLAEKLAAEQIKFGYEVQIIEVTK